jgi:hypothetical protein
MTTKTSRRVLADAKAKTRRKTSRSKKPSDTALIRECVIYAQSVAAFHTGFKADPDGSSVHAESIGNKFDHRAWQALTKIAATPATTPAGLCSKARIVEIVFEDSAASYVQEDQTAFLKAFGLEVKKFLQPICDGDLVLQARAAVRP